MNSRERARCALNHEQPDRAPIEIGGLVTSLTYGEYRKFTGYFGIADPKADIGGFKVMCNLDEEILQRTHTDFRTLYFAPKSPDWAMKKNEDGTLTDIWGIRYRDVGDYYEMIEYPLAGDWTPDDLERFPWPDFTDMALYEGIGQQAKGLYENTEYSLIGTMGLNVMERAQWMRGLEAQLMDMYVDEEFAVALLDKTTAMLLDYLERYLPLVRDYVDVMDYGDDLATQESLIMSPEIYRKIIKPRQAKVFDYIKKNSNAKIFYHCCGAAVPIIGDLMEIGVDILNPVQPLAKGMDFTYLKKTFGDGLVFWGAIDEQRLLPHGTPDEVRAETKRAIDILGKNGGYVCAPAHNVQSDVPVENVLAMCDCAAEYRG